MKKTIAILLSLIFVFSACGDYYYKIKLNNTKDVKEAILMTDSLIKKIDVLSSYEYMYPSFWTSDGSINISYTTLNNNPNDSIREGRSNTNRQYNIDTCKAMPGLTDYEWSLLKNSLNVLKNNGITGNRSALYCNKNKFYFFFYSYFYPNDWQDMMDLGFLAVLPDSIIESSCFKEKYRITDEKNGLYMIRKVNHFY